MRNAPSYCSAATTGPLSCRAASMSARSASISGPESPGPVDEVVGGDVRGAGRVRHGVILAQPRRRADCAPDSPAVCGWQSAEVDARRTGKRRPDGWGSPRRWLDGGGSPGTSPVSADGTVDAVGVRPPVARGLAVAGFVDLQVNGFGGVDLATADNAGYRRAAVALARTGVTSYLPTLPSHAPAAYGPALAVAPRGRRGGGAGRVDRRRCAAGRRRLRRGPGRWASTSRGRSWHRPERAPTGVEHLAAARCVLAARLLALRRCAW